MSAVKIVKSQLLVFGSLLCLLGVSVQAADVFGLVLFREGKTLVTRDILEFEAQVEEILFYDDEIETGEDGSLQITFDASFITIGPNTICTIEKEVVNGEEIIKVVLDQGSLRSKILNLGSKQFFEVHSDSGKLRVHGTDFVAAVDPASATQGFDVSVIQGRVAVEGPKGDLGPAAATGQSILLTQRQSSTVDSSPTSGQINQISLQAVGNLKQSLPIPGDDQNQIQNDDLGIKNLVAVEIVDEITQSLVPEGKSSSLEGSVQDSSDIDTIASLEILKEILGGKIPTTISEIKEANDIASGGSASVINIGDLDP